MVSNTGYSAFLKYVICSRGRRVLYPEQMGAQLFEIKRPSSSYFKVISPTCFPIEKWNPYVQAKTIPILLIDTHRDNRLPSFSLQ